MLPNNQYLGVQINNYTITKELASGGFGSVFLAKHNKLNRTIAIKLPLAAHLGSQQQQDQFIQEALAELQQAIRLDATLADAYYNMGIAPIGHLRIK